jgi:pimeloyl-ACP methyl ester carboxylesterase
MWAALRAPPLPAPIPEAACSVEQVRLHTGDGVLLEGILYRPAASPRSAAFLLVHGFGANYYEAYFPALARAAAAQGYASLALNMRDHDAGPKVSDFRDNQADIAAGLAHLRSLGYPKAVLLGQSMSTNRVLYYQAATRDSGIVAVVLVSGPGNLFEWNVRQFGRKKAQATLDEALALCRRRPQAAVDADQSGAAGQRLVHGALSSQPARPQFPIGPAPKHSEGDQPGSDPAGDGR